MVSLLQKIPVRLFSLKNYPVETGLKVSVHALFIFITFRISD